MVSEEKAVFTMTNAVKFLLHHHVQHTNDPSVAHRAAKHIENIEEVESHVSHLTNDTVGGDQVIEEGGPNDAPVVGKQSVSNKA